MRVKLGPGERVIVRTRPDPRRLAGPFLGALVIVAATAFGLGWLSRNNLPGVPGFEPLGADLEPLAAGLIAAVGAILLVRIFVRPFLRWLGTRYILTSRRLIRRRGIGRRAEHELALAAIYQLDTDQSLIQRATGGGTLTVDLGRDRTVSYPGVPQVAVFKGFVVEAIAELPLTVMFDGVGMEINPGAGFGSEPGPRWEDDVR